MRKTYYFAIMSFLMASCTGIPKEKEVTVSDVGLSGTLKEYVDIVDGTYTFTHNEEDAFITIEFVLTEKPMYESTPILKESYGSSLILQPIDSKGNFIDLGFYGFEAQDTELQKINDLLSNGNQGDKKKVLFTMPYFNQNENKKLLFTDASDFEIVDKAFGYESEEDIIREESTYPDIEINNLESSSSSSSNNSNNDYDKLLDSYEEYVDQYLKFAKKAVNDDMSAMSEYAVLMEKMTHLAESLDNAKGNMSSRQMKRYLDITNKYATGLTEISE